MPRFAVGLLRVQSARQLLTLRVSVQSMSVRVRHDELRSRDIALSLPDSLLHQLSATSHEHREPISARHRNQPELHTKEHFAHEYLLCGLVNRLCSRSSRRHVRHAHGKRRRIHGSIRRYEFALHGRTSRDHY
jgi:hypothetical protein